MERWFLFIKVPSRGPIWRFSVCRDVSGGACWTFPVRQRDSELP